MTSLLAKTVLAAVLGLSALAVSVPAASAAPADATIEAVGYRNGFHGHDRGHDWRQGRGQDREWNRDRRPQRWNAGGRCAPRLAVEKARGYGLHHARIAHVTPRHVVVEGVRFNHHGRIAFANARHCPVLWR